MPDAAVDRVLTVRERHGEMSLGKLYSVGVIPPDLVDAHIELDRAVDRLYAPRRKNLTELDRLTILIERYRSVVEAGTLRSA